MESFSSSASTSAKPRWPSTWPGEDALHHKAGERSLSITPTGSPRSTCSWSPRSPSGSYKAISIVIGNSTKCRVGIQREHCPILKVFAFLGLTGVAFMHEHIFDASNAPRGQLPYTVDEGEMIGDSNTIIAHLVRKYLLPIDHQLTSAQRHIGHRIIRMLDDLY